MNLKDVLKGIGKIVGVADKVSPIVALGSLLVKSFTAVERSAEVLKAHGEGAPSGDEKRAAAVDLFKTGAELFEGIKGDDLLNDDLAAEGVNEVLSGLAKLQKARRQ